jgi:hypothetical protein
VASTYVNNLRLEEMTTGEKSGTWGNITNTNLQLVGQALGYGTRAIANASTDNITIADGASDADRSMYLKLTGGGQACTVTLLPNTSSKMWIMENATSYTLTFTQGSGANVAIPAGQTKMIFADGLGAGAVVYELGTIAVQNIQADGTVTVGIDDTGYDVTFFGATTGKKLFWDESADTLNVAGTTALDGSLSVTGVTSNADGSAAAPSITNTGDTNTGIFFPAADTVGVAVGGTEVWRYGSNPTTAKNLIMNGSMRVAQRGTVTSPADLAYTLDGWQTRYSSSATITISQDTTGIFAGIGGSPTCMKIDCTGAEASVAAGEYYVIRQKIETQNCDFLNYAQADALPVTLSFNIQSPKSGTHTGVLGNNAASSRSYAFNFTVASADTPERVSVTIPGDTAGSAIGQGATTEGLRLNIPLLCGADNAKAAGSWGANIYEAGSGTPNLLDSTANNIYLGDVQLEVGSVATDFEHEDYGTTLAKCQRYLFGINNALDGDVNVAFGMANGTTLMYCVVRLPNMRAVPTLTATATDWELRDLSGLNQALTAIDLNTSSENYITIQCTVASGLTQYRSYYLKADGTLTRTILISAEL